MPHLPTGARVPIARAGIILAVTATPSIVAAQQRQHHCSSICTPSVSLNVAVLRSHIFGGPQVRTLATGRVSRIPSTSNLELQLFVAAPTVIPHVGLFFTTQWLPNAEARSNPFTEYSATALGGTVRANMPSVTLGGDLQLVPKTSTGGALAVVLYAGDLFSQASRPHDRSAYTHKLDLGGYVTLYPFFALPKRSPLARTGLYLYATLDYVATGLPKAGDEVPAGERVYVTGARPAALVAGAGFPIAPLFH